LPHVHDPHPPPDGAAPDFAEPPVDAPKADHSFFNLRDRQVGQAAFVPPRTSSSNFAPHFPQVYS
jgi:hypothetical protein